MSSRRSGPGGCSSDVHPGERPRLRDLGLQVGSLPVGPANAITDVAGVMVGHHTLHDPEAGVCTGVTAIRPHPDNLFREKVWAAVHVINGFGKAMGLPQIAELGTVETPIVLTNTLSVGIAAHGVVRWMLAMDPGIGGRAGTVNPVVMECSDGYLNDLRRLAVQPEHVLLALDNAKAGSTLGHGSPREGMSGVTAQGADSSLVRPDEGAVGAGMGMVCYGYKGGIGTASRVVAGGAGTYVVGVMVLANFGRRGELRVLGRRITESGSSGSPHSGDTGSVIVVVATDAPLTSRQLGRLARRAVVGLARTGSYVSHGSGEFVAAFSTATRVFHDTPDEVLCVGLLPDHGGTFAGLLVAVADATEECVYNALFRARTTRGYRGRAVEALPVEALGLNSTW